MTYQTTIERPASIKGVGLHTAVKSHLRLVPAPSNTGIVFRRVDLDNFEIEAHVRNVARVSYATSLMKKGVLLSTTEHVLAALFGLRIDNCEVWVDQPELPGFDGLPGAWRFDKCKKPVPLLHPPTTIDCHDANGL